MFIIFPFLLILCEANIDVGFQAIQILIAAMGVKGRIFSKLAVVMDE